MVEYQPLQNSLGFCKVKILNHQNIFDCKNYFQQSFLRFETQEKMGTKKHRRHDLTVAKIKGKRKNTVGVALR